MSRKVLSSKSSVHFKNQADGSDIELSIKGDWFDRSASITLGERVVASISRKLLNMREIFADSQTVGLNDDWNSSVLMIYSIL